ncbi:hypothetical protein VIRA109638_14305 [Vibrio rarus]
MIIEECLVHVSTAQVDVGRMSRQFITLRLIGDILN